MRLNVYSFPIRRSARRKNSIRRKWRRLTRSTRGLMAMFDKYGVPTYAMVGTEAASQFVTMIQHQSSAFRRKVLPKLKANVDAGQGDQGAFAMVYDRSRRDAGKKQRYGE